MTIHTTEGYNLEGVANLVITESTYIYFQRDDF